MKMLRRIAKWFVVSLVLLFLAIQFIRPARTNPAVDESQTIFACTQMTPQVTAIFNRSCVDCHSNKTVWPWYSNVMPVSFFLVGHVDHGRKTMNMSEWGHLDHERQERRLRQICDVVSDGVMPLSSYMPMHPNAKLSAEDKKTLCDWTDAERARLAKAETRP